MISDKNTPAIYSKSTRIEFRSISRLNIILNIDLVRPHISENDRTPNIDGYIILLDEKGGQKGKIEVQVKTIQDKNLHEPKCLVKREFLSYCCDSIYPVLLIGVNDKTRLAYWMHIGRTQARSYLNKTSGKHKTINFQRENVISESDTGYSTQWLKIHDELRTKILDYDRIKRENDELQKNKDMLATAFLKEPVNPQICFEVHKFLDVLNGALDFEYKTVKEICYPNMWKMGLGYTEYTERALTYFLYPIDYRENLPNITKLNKITVETIQALKISEMHHHPMANLIRTNVNKLAALFFQGRVQFILKNRLIIVPSETLAMEFITAFLQKYHTLLGLPYQKEYDLVQAERAFNQFLPLWFEEHNAETPEDELEGKTIRALYYFLDGNFNDIDTNNRIAQKVQSKLQTIPDLIPTKNISVESSEFPFQYIARFIDYLQSIEVTKVTNPFKPIWTPRPSGNVIDIEAVKENIELQQKTLRILRRRLIETYFPHLEKLLPLFGPNYMEVILIDSFAPTELPRVRHYNLQKNNGKTLASIEVHIKNPYPELDEIPFPKSDIVIQGEYYKMISGTITPELNETFTIERLLFNEVEAAFNKFFEEVIYTNHIFSS